MGGGGRRGPLLPALCQCAAAVFPRVTIYYLQITGKYKPLTPKAEPVDVSVEDDPEPADAQQSAPDEKGVKRNKWN